MAWSPHPNQVVKLYDGGTGNMGDLADDDSQARFAAPDEQAFVLAYVRAHFYHASGTGVANLQIVRHRPTSELWTNMQLFQLDDRGRVAADGDADVNFRVLIDGMHAWTFSPRDILVLTWTNPGTINWMAEVGVIPI